MSKSLSNQKYDATIVNCIRQNMNAGIAMRLYTHNKRIRSIMIESIKNNFNIKCSHTHKFEQQNELFSKYTSQTDQKFVTIRSGSL